ncbi:hypothetical protein C0995_000904 [Termitomyces sp. Mi166|nr:hypothetical protein C0995_000904 [Termitomyces sp. Mi166\
MAPHPVTEYTSEASWAMVRSFKIALWHNLTPDQVEDKFSPYAKETLAKLIAFLEEEIHPASKLAHAQLPVDPVERWKTTIPVISELKEKAKKLGLWNLFLSKAHYPEHGVPLTNLEYAVMAEILGRGAPFAAEVVNCSAPDTGNMEVLARYGSPQQQKKWLIPLLNGEIRSAFAMTEKNVASSDATNIRTSIRKEGNEIVINGHKWSKLRPPLPNESSWISGAGDPRTKVHIVMGKSDPGNKSTYKQQSVVIVPADTPGVKVVRPMHVFGYDDAPEGHCEIIYDNVRVPLENLVLGWGRGFEIIQGRLGPGRIHHCMRSIGVAQAALDLMLERVTDPGRKTFGKYLYEHGSVIQDIAKSRAEIESARLLVLSAALQIDIYKAKGALKEIGIAKVCAHYLYEDFVLTFAVQFVVPSMALTVVDRAIQSFGAEGVSQDTELAQRWAGLRTLRIADVHIQQVGQRELRRAPRLAQKTAERRKREQAMLKKAGIKSPYTPAPQRMLPDEKLRALVSLYHQADNFITLDNLSERIDEAFINRSRLVPLTDFSSSVKYLKGRLAKQRKEARVTEWDNVPPKSGPETSFDDSKWSTVKMERELKVKQALYGLSDQGNLPGIEILKGSAANGVNLSKLESDIRDLIKGDSDTGPREPSEASGPCQPATAMESDIRDLIKDGCDTGPHEPSGASGPCQPATTMESDVQEPIKDDFGTDRPSRAF